MRVWTFCEFTIINERGNSCYAFDMRSGYVTQVLFNVEIQKDSIQ